MDGDGEKAFRYFDIDASYASAVAYCRSFGGRTATFKSNNEYAFLQQGEWKERYLQNNQLCKLIGNNALHVQNKIVPVSNWLSHNCPQSYSYAHFC